MSAFGGKADIDWCMIGIIPDPKCDILFIPDGVLGAGEAMRRREFIRLFGSTVVAWPLTARAQQAAMPIVAYLSVGSLDATAGRVNAFRKGLGETGYAEGRNVQVEYHWLEGQYEHLTAVLDDLIRRHVAVMAIPGSLPVSLAAKISDQHHPDCVRRGGRPGEAGPRDEPCSTRW